MEITSQRQQSESWRQTSSSSDVQAALERRAADLYVHMARIFGPAWTSKYGETDDGTWAAAVSTLAPSQVRFGLRWMLNNWTDSFPPTPGQFRRVIFDNNRPEHRALPHSSRIEMQPAEDHVRQQHMEHIRIMLGMSD